MEKNKKILGIHDSRKNNVIKTDSPLIIHDSRKKINKYNLSFLKKIILLYDNNKKLIINSIIFLIFLVIILFPTWSGNLLGLWFKNFIGTFLNIIDTI